MNAKKLIFFAAALGILALAGWGLKNKFSKPAKTGARLVTVTEGPVEDAVEATGAVAPLNRVEIKPPIAGRIEKLLVDEGDTVRSGQTLAWMSSSDRAAILDAARAKGEEELKKWEDAYKATPIIAPLSGVIILRNVVVGQTVDSGVVLYAMSDNLVVIAQVDESDIGRIHTGMPARVTLDAYPDQPVSGKVFDILHEGKNVSNVIQYGVKIKPAKVPSNFRSQMTANVSFIVNRKENAVMVPSSAVRENASGIKEVMVPGPDGSPMAREVQTGIETASRVEIIDGLKVGEKILLASKKYSPQQSPQSSPLTLGGRPSSSNSSQGSRPRRGQ